MGVESSSANERSVHVHVFGGDERLVTGYLVGSTMYEVVSVRVCTFTKNNGYNGRIRIRGTLFRFVFHPGLL